MIIKILYKQVRIWDYYIIININILHQLMFNKIFQNILHYNNKLLN